jgi:hypothetical protein
MAGNSNSGRPSLSDAEKKALGTFRQDRSEEVRLARDAAKIVTGIFLPKVPEPSLPLNEIGRGKYFEIATLLFNDGKLSMIVVEDVQRYAVMFQQASARMTAGKHVSQQLLDAMDSLLRRLRVAESAKPLAPAEKGKRFDGAGFSNNRSSPLRLRSPSAA